MTEEFSRAVDALLRRADPPAAPKTKLARPPAKRDVRDVADQRRRWFAEFAVKEAMPLVNEVVETARRHGIAASARLAEENGHLAADLVMVPRGLPNAAKPPRLTLYAADGELPLMIEYTGTFPGVGATGGFGAEIDYDPIHPSQIEEKILDFVELATGA